MHGASYILYLVSGWCICVGFSFQLFFSYLVGYEGWLLFIVKPRVSGCMRNRCGMLMLSVKKRGGFDIAQQDWTGVR